MFDKILIANRGEVALRVMRAARELGVKTVAVYSTEDKDTYPVQYADEAVCIGPAPSGQSYLNVANIITAAKNTGAQAIHPGYGFLAENADFARACVEEGLVFIGPSAECIERMGDKASARETMMACGVPTVPGSDGICESVEDARQFAEQVGYPVLIKATAGGGGKGMREVHAPEDLESQYKAACTEAGAAFGNAGVYLEKLVLRVDYRNAGTIEFLLDESGSFYFMEMNTRVQVEHPVTEMITDTDIIKEQIRIAAGEPMSCADRAPFFPNGHAIEMRINAEDPEHNFRPCPGIITKFDLPGGPGIRVETYIKQGSKISPFYDSLVAKLICHGQDRQEAVERAKRALDEFVIEGIATTIPFHKRVLENEVFLAGDATTDFIETQMGDLL